MKLLYVRTVTGKEDSALFFERTHDKKQMLDLWFKSKEEWTYSFEYEEEKIKVHLQSYLFKNVDSKFIDFIRVFIQDYDESKVNNFYIVE
jgi:hypothetical protein